MNPLPNRPLLNNGNISLTLPNAPPFEQMAFNGRPRKLLPETGKDFPMLNGNILMSGPSSAPATTGSQVPNLERSNPIGSGMLQLQHLPQQSSSNPASMQQNAGPSQPPPLSNVSGDRDSDSEPRQLTAIFRPDDAGEWKEKLRLSHEAEQARFARESQQGWDRRSDEDDGKDEDTEVDDDESSVVSDGEGNKVWRPKRTLRKCVELLVCFCYCNAYPLVSHLDAVRALAFHPHELSLATGGDDCTVKIWRMDVAGLASSAYASVRL
jgi:striatin 1/3/4